MKTARTKPDTAAAPETAPAAPASPAPGMPAPLPAEGGRWIRRPDGALERAIPALKGA